jgi:hypothetical protein
VAARNGPTPNAVSPSRRSRSSLVRGGQRYAMEDGDFDAAALRAVDGS